MALIAIVADKGAPGVTTTAVALAAVWPRPVLLAECDPAGGDLTYRLPAAGGGRLDPQRGLLSLAVASRRGIRPQDVWAHTQKLHGGLDVLTGVTTAEQGAGLEPMWDALGTALARLPQADVIADCGRIGVDGPYYDLLARAAAVVFVTRDNLADVVRLRERIAVATAAIGRRDSFGTRISVVVVADHKRFHSALGEVANALSQARIRVAIAGGLAYEPKSADQLRGEWGGKLDKSLLIRTARDVATQVAVMLPAMGPGAGRPEEPERPPVPQRPRQQVHGAQPPRPAQPAVPAASAQPAASVQPAAPGRNPLYPAAAGREPGPPRPVPGSPPYPAVGGHEGGHEAGRPRQVPGGLGPPAAAAGREPIAPRPAAGAAYPVTAARQDPRYPGTRPMPVPPPGGQRPLTPGPQPIPQQPRSPEPRPLPDRQQRVQPDRQQRVLPDRQQRVLPDRQQRVLPDRQPGALPDRQPGAPPDRQPGAPPDRQPGALPDRPQGAPPETQRMALPGRQEGALPDRQRMPLRDREPGALPGRQPMAPPDRQQGAPAGWPGDGPGRRPAGPQPASWDGGHPGRPPQRPAAFPGGLREGAGREGASREGAGRDSANRDGASWDGLRRGGGEPEWGGGFAGDPHRNGSDVWRPAQFAGEQDRLGQEPPGRHAHPGYDRGPEPPADDTSPQPGRPGRG